MDRSLIDLPLRGFADELAAGTPTPGGGGAAALAGALGAALLAMVCRFTVGRERFASAEAEVQRILDQAEAARLRLLDAIDADASAYGEVAAAYRLPRGNESEQSARAEAIRQASWSAAQPPLAVAEEAAALLELCRAAAPITNPMLASDVVTAEVLAVAALEGGAANVEANLSGLDEARAAELRGRLARARARRT